MKTELVGIPTPTNPLDGAYCTPDGPAKNGILYFHGNQMNFYVCAARFLAPSLTALGYAFLAFNRRGHDTLSIRDGREPEGGAFQTLAEAVEDNELAARFLSERGVRRPILIGHSFGGLLAAHFAARHPEVRALVLLSAHAGGKDVARRLSERGLWAGDRLEELTAHAHQSVAGGRPRALMLLPGWWHVVSAQTFTDYATNCPDLIEEAQRVQCPVLYIRGDREPRGDYPAEAFRGACPGPCEVAVVDDCDHFYVAAEDRITQIVCRWLTRTLG